MPYRLLLIRDEMNLGKAHWLPILTAVHERALPNNVLYNRQHDVLRIIIGLREGYR